MKKLDWDKLKKFVSERDPIKVSAGLVEDWGSTSDVVYSNNEWDQNNDAYLSSVWATPCFKALMPNGDVIEVLAFVEVDECDS